MTDYTVYKLSTGEWVRYGLTGIVIAGIAAFVFYRNLIVFAILAAPAAILYPLYKKRDLYEERKRRLSSEFREAITVLASALSAGYSMENAMIETGEELKLIYDGNSMIVREFDYMNHRVKMNVPVETAWQEFAGRSGTDDIENFARVIRAAKRTGGELNSIIMRTADTIGDKIRIKEEILTQTAEKRLEQKVMSIIPIVIVLYIEVTSPGFFGVMYETAAGRIIMTVCLAAYIAAILIGQKILEIEV